MDIPLKIRLEVFNRADGLCEVCHSKGDWRGLAMHHIKLRAQGGKHEADNLELLCGGCHSKKHGIREVK